MLKTMQEKQKTNGNGNIDKEETYKVSFTYFLEDLINSLNHDELTISIILNEVIERIDGYTSKEMLRKRIGRHLFILHSLNKISLIKKTDNISFHYIIKTNNGK